MQHKHKNDAGLHVMRPLFFNQNCNVLTSAGKTPQYQLLENLFSGNQVGTCRQTETGNHCEAYIYISATFHSECAKRREFLGHMSIYQLLKRDHTPTNIY
jgi:hypothetical protein